MLCVWCLSNWDAFHRDRRSWSWTTVFELLWVCGLRYCSRVWYGYWAYHHLQFDTCTIKIGLLQEELQACEICRKLLLSQNLLESCKTFSACLTLFSEFDLMFLTISYIWYIHIRGFYWVLLYKDGLLYIEFSFFNVCNS